MERDRPDVREKRERWFSETIAGIPVSKLVFLDESGANTQMQPAYGRAPRGQRVHSPIPHGHYISVTMVAAIRRSGPFAAHSFVGAMNAERFRTWVNVHLIPGLRKGDVIIMDNLPVHKDAEARRAIEKAKALVLFLPPYSPDLNPDENLWSKTTVHDYFSNTAPAARNNPKAISDTRLKSLATP